jgi:hypothetical protein
MEKFEWLPLSRTIIMARRIYTLLEWAIHASVWSDGHTERDHVHVATDFVVATSSVCPRTASKYNDKRKYNLAFLY